MSFSPEGPAILVLVAAILSVFHAGHHSRRARGGVTIQGSADVLRGIILDIVTVYLVVWGIFAAFVLPERAHQWVLFGGMLVVACSAGIRQRRDKERRAALHHEQLSRSSQ
ncbi:hypothetical protein [Georgenia alba]|uniref:Uncharacterized protein n=1 Tax=Georgenia alba TaxID=2233858 RepID=A0ABW2Q207_9MICO